MSVKLISIYRLKNRPYYYADYEYQGKRHCVSLKSDKKQKAYLLWYDIKESFEQKEVILPIIPPKDNAAQEPVLSISITESIKSFMASRNNRLQASTIRSMKWSLKRFSEHLALFNIHSTAAILQKHIENFIELLEDEQKSNKTINNYISILNSYLAFLNKRNYSSLNSIDKKLWKKSTKSKIELFDKNQARIIIERVKLINNPAYQVMLLSPFFTGMRYSELKALNKKNIDLQNRMIYVKEKQTPDDKNPINTLKTAAAKRKIPILKEFHPILEEYVNKTEHDYIFNDINYKTLSNLRRRLSKELQIPFRFHDGRHFFASLLIHNRFDFKTIQTILGHEDIRMTFNIYGHIIDSIKAEDFDRIVF